MEKRRVDSGGEMTAISSLCAASAGWCRGEGASDTEETLSGLFGNVNQYFMIGIQASDYGAPGLSHLFLLWP
jgi:hypothetical protein